MFTVSKIKAVSIITIVFVGAFLLGWFNRLDSKKTTEENYEAGYEAAKKKLVESGMIPSVQDIRFLSGQITKVEGDKVYFAVNLINPLDDESLKERVVVIKNGTKIYLRAFKLPEEVVKENEKRQGELETLREQFSKEKDAAKKTQIQTAITELQAPLPIYDEKEITRSELKENIIISVQADENIAFKKEFNAEKIFVQGNPGVNSPMVSGDTPLPAEVTAADSNAPPPAYEDLDSNSPDTDLP